MIVALAAAWLVVLVPMVARNRQEVARPADSALSARVVRSGNVRNERRKEFAMADNETEQDVAAAREPVDGADDYVDDGYGYVDDGYVDDGYRDGDYPDDYVGDRYADDYADSGSERDSARYADDEFEEPAPEETARPARAYRPGRGGFDPEAAEIAARAKYTYRQRVVLGLLVAAVVTAIVAAVIAPVLWWLHAIVDMSLVGYLVYLRRQVRIENDIRQRRTERLGRSSDGPRVRGASERPERAEPDGDEAYEDEFAERSDDYSEVDRDQMRAARSMRRPQRKPIAEPIQHNGVYVDLDDEDPEFHELDHPGEQPLRKASGQ